MDLFDSEVAPHGIISGVSGSGKSFMTNHLIASALSRGDTVFLIDRGNSYRKLCRLFGGRYVTFDPDRPVRVNPCGRSDGFTRDRHQALVDLLVEMTAEAPGGGASAADLTKAERGLLTRAVAAAYVRGGDEEVTLTDLRREIEREARNLVGERGTSSMAPRAAELAMALEPFTGTGPYGGFLDGPDEVPFDAQLVVFEMGEIALRKEIASVLLMALLGRIGAFSGSPDQLGRRKYLVLDEAWTMLGSPATARFLENALRTYRKLNTAALMVTQQVSDFTNGAAGAAILANAPNRIFLMQTAETLQAIGRMLELSKEEKAAIGSVRTLKGQYSEAYVQTPSARGVVRLVADPRLYWLATSDAADNARLEELAAKAGNDGNTNPFLTALDSIASGKAA